MKVKKNELKKQFQKTIKLSIEYNFEKHFLDDLIEAYYGFHYSDRNMDYIIDSIDYGQGITFEEFNSIMTNEKKELKDES
jgi:hypothetical protein